MKINEIIIKGQQTDSFFNENLRDWFKKDKWVRMDTKGNIKGDCAKEPGEGKPKCLPQAKAHALGKKGRAAAAQKKRREDPNPDRKGKAINVSTKTKNESLEYFVNEGICPHCAGEMVHESVLNEKQDACYHKVKSRYKVWPSAYASGALVQCRKKGAKNWGKSKTNENFADGKKPGRKGLSKRVGIPKDATVAELRKIAKNSTGEKQRMAHWQANMKSGKKKNA